MFVNPKLLILKFVPNGITKPIPNVIKVIPDIISHNMLSRFKLLLKIRQPAMASKNPRLITLMGLMIFTIRYTVKDAIKRLFTGIYSAKPAVNPVTSINVK